MEVMGYGCLRWAMRVKGLCTHLRNVSSLLSAFSVSVDVVRPSADACAHRHVASPPAPTAAAIAPPPPPQQQQQQQLDYAAALTGQQRSLFSAPVVASFRRHVPRCDVHLVVVGEYDESAKSALAGRAAKLYSPVAFRTIQSDASSFNFPHCEPKPRGRWLPVLVAWVGIRRAYEDIEASERRRGRQYEWILRLRTDVVYFEDLAVEALDARFVHLPSGGMAASEDTRFTNDHLFICPRRLCRAYFYLTELWESPLCDASGRSVPGIFANVTHDGTLTPNAPATRAYSVPPQYPAMPMGLSNHIVFAEWYILARYSANGRCAVPLRQSTCGLVHEFDLAYTIARGDDRSGHLDCCATLRSGWRTTSAAWPRIDRLYPTCQRLSQSYFVGSSNTSTGGAATGDPNDHCQGNVGAGAAAHGVLRSKLGYG